MQQLSMLFEGLTSKKATAKEIKTAIQQEVESHPRFKEITDNLKLWKAELEMIKAQAKDNFDKELSALDDIKAGMENDKEKMTDIALSMLTKGESTEFEYKGNKYFAKFSVNIKRI